MLRFTRTAVTTDLIVRSVQIYSRNHAGRAVPLSLFAGHRQLSYHRYDENSALIR